MKPRFSGATTCVHSSCIYTPFSTSTSNDYINITINNLKNFYSLNYWFKMMPVPHILKKIYNYIFSKMFKNFILGFKAGNLYLIAKKN